MGEGVPSCMDACADIRSPPIAAKKTAAPGGQSSRGGHEHDGWNRLDGDERSLIAHLLKSLAPKVWDFHQHYASRALQQHKAG